MSDELETNGADSPIEVRTIHYKELHWIRLPLISILVYFLVFFVATALSNWLSSRMVIQSNLIFFGIIGLSLLAAAVIHVRFTGPGNIRRLYHYVEKMPDVSPRSMLDYLIIQERRSQDSDILAVALGLLVEKGFSGSAYRLWKHKPRPPVVEPLAQTFEPRLIDETEAGLVALAHDATAQPGDDGHEQAAHDDDIRKIPRSMRRNVLLKGGYLFLLIALMWFTRDVVRFIRTGEFPFTLILSSLGIAGLLWLPVSGGAISTEQWLVLPGGLLRRTPKRRSTESDLYLFNARRSLLLAIQTPSKAWQIHVSDGEECDWFDATTVEMEIVFRAWCSPIAPPMVEQLSDFR